MTIERTKEMDELCERTIFLIKEVEKFEKNAKGCVPYILGFLVVGIFFFPCLIVAALAFGLRLWGLKQVEIACEELDRINQVPGIVDYIHEFYAPKSP